MKACCRIETPRSPPEPEIAERELAILWTLAQEGGGAVAFQGLRRRLDLHQQALARILKRLTRDGLVAKAEAGYRLTEAGFASLPGSGRCCRLPTALPFVQALLPKGVNGERVADHLSRRWFKGLRWYGRADLPGETVLSWLMEDTDQLVRVRVAENALTMEAEVEDEDPQEAFAAARGVLQALADLYGVEAKSPTTPRPHADESEEPVGDRVRA